MKHNSFQFEVPFDTMEKIVEYYEPEEGIEILMTGFKQALLDYVIRVVAEEGSDEDEACLS